MHREEAVAEALRARGYRLTPQRLAILRELLAAEGHPSAEEVHARVHADWPMVSLATVYKTAALLRDIGEVLELPGHDRATRYDPHRPEPHAHLVCARCGRVDDAPWSSSPGELGAWRLDGRVDHWGICPRCAAAGAAGVGREHSRTGDPE